MGPGPDARSQSSLRALRLPRLCRMVHDVLGALPLSTGLAALGSSASRAAHGGYSEHCACVRVLRSPSALRLARLLRSRDCCACEHGAHATLDALAALATPGGVATLVTVARLAASAADQTLARLLRTMRVLCTLCSTPSALRLARAAFAPLLPAMQSVRMLRMMRMTRSPRQGRALVVVLAWLATHAAYQVLAHLLHRMCVLGTRCSTSSLRLRAPIVTPGCRVQ